MTEPTLTVRSAEDLLALVPTVLGFHPRDSLVLVALDRPDDAPGFARVDLPPPGSDPEEVAEAVASLVHLVVRTRLSRLALVYYAEEATTVTAFDAGLRPALDKAQVQVAETVRADGRRWHPVPACDAGCCPAGGTPYDLTAHPLTARAVAEGKVLHASREELADSLRQVDPAAARAVQIAAGTALRRLVTDTAASPRPDPPQLSPLLVVEGRWAQHRVRRFLADEQALDDRDAGRLLGLLLSIPVRDVVWSLLDRECAAGHVRLWRGLLGRTSVTLLPAPAALLGFAAWLSGDGALAWCAVERCQDADPDYRMAALLTQALAAGLPPSSWRPIPADELPLFAQTPGMPCWEGAGPAL